MRGTSPNEMKDLARPQDVRYWQEVEQVAFLIWFENNGNYKKVEEILNTDPMWRELARLEEGEKAPTHRTIRRWADDNFWSIKAAQKMQEAIPLKVRAAAQIIAYGTEDAAKSMMRIAKGQDVNRDDRTVMEAAKFVLNSTLSDSISTVIKPVVEQTVDISNLETMEEIVEAEQRIRELDV